MKQFVIKDESNNIVAKVDMVLASDMNDRLQGEKTLQFTAILGNGLEKMKEEKKYTVAFEDDYYDVVSFKKTLSGSLCFMEISCEHVSYRLNEKKFDIFSCTGTAEQILMALLAGTDFSVDAEEFQKEITYSSQQSATIRAILFDFAGNNGYEVCFDGFKVRLAAHRGKTEDTKILQQNVLEISKTINVSEESAAYFLKLNPKIPVGVGDEIHLLFNRLGIDDHVRVLGIKRQPFISEYLTLEVGAYVPDLESESVRIITDMMTQNTAYYGTKISAENGLEVNREDGNARVVFNADKMAFYQGNEEILYFDPVEKKWKMSASMEVYVSDGAGKDTTLSVFADGLSTKIQDAEDHYIEIKETVDGITVKTQSGETLIDGGMIVTDNMQLHRLIAKGSPNSYVEMLTNGLNFVLGNSNTIGIGYASAKLPLPYIIFGEGASPQSDQSGMIKFYDGGLWLGDSADRHSETIQSGTGLFVDVPNDKIYIYTNGVRAEVSNQTNVAGLISELKEYLDGRLDEFQPVAVFG